MTTSMLWEPSISRWGPREVPNADQVVRREPEEKHPADPRAPAMTRLTQQRDGLEPAEDLLDPFARTLAQRVAGMACRPRVDRAAAVRGVLRDVGRDAERAQQGHAVARVVRL